MRKRYRLVCLIYVLQRVVYVSVSGILAIIVVSSSIIESARMLNEPAFRGFKGMLPQEYIKF